MSKHLSNLNSKRIPVSFIIMLIFFLGTELFFRQFAYSLYSSADRIIVNKRTFLNKEKDLQFDALILGDSRALGVDDELLSKSITQTISQEMNIFNLSMPHSDVRAYYLILKNYLKRNQKPQFIVLSAMPSLFTKEWNVITADKKMSIALHRFYLLFPLKDLIEVFPLSFLIKNSLITKTEMISFFITYRVHIKYALLKWKLFDSFEKQNNLKADGEKNKKADRKPPSVERIKNSFWYHQRLIIDQDSVAWYKKFLSLAQENGIEVIIAHAPLNDIIFEHREREHINHRYRYFITGIERQFANVSLLRPILPHYPRAYFVDEHHLNKQGYKNFTESLVDEISKYLISLKEY